MNWRKINCWLVFTGIIIMKGYGQTTMQNSSFAELRNKISEDKEHITVLNFWATWCRPCVAELPDFEKINADFKKNKVNVILANIDFNSQTESLVPAFIKKK